MPVNICKDSIDLGIVTKNSAALIKFYRDTLGLEQAGEQDMPGGGHMTRLMAGTTTVKIVVNGKDPKGEAAPGGLRGATGYRYFTITVNNLAEAAEECAAAGYQVPVPAIEIAPGVTIAMIEDPDGNWVELLQHG